jgi:hypothetical protein
MPHHLMQVNGTTANDLYTPITNTTSGHSTTILMLIILAWDQYFGISACH